MLSIQSKPIRPKQSEANEMNKYKECRLKAAQHNDVFASRERAAEELGISKEQLRNYEVGACKNVPPESVLIMADAYQEPLLLEYYCIHECPIGRERTNIRTTDISATVLQIIYLLRQVPDIENQLLEVTSDGEITDAEKAQIIRVSQYFNRLYNCSMSLTRNE